MEIEWLLQLVLFGILHWILAILLLRDLSARKKVLGGRKALWAALILLLTFLGSLIYLLCHPQIFRDSERDEDL